MTDRIKLIGIDLDGTFLKDDKTLCDGAADTIRRAAEAGICTVPITGRPFSGIPPVSYTHLTLPTNSLV